MDDDGFIGLPPGMSPPPVDHDSGTVRRERPDRPRVEREEIVFFPVVPGATAPVTTDPAPPVGEQIDDATRAAVSRHAATSWRLVLADRSVPVQDVLFLGRDPVASAGHAGAAVLAVDDPRKSVSKTHAMLEVDGNTLWVHDLESTNGVWVVPAGADAIEVVPGHRAPVPAGADIELGDLVIQVEHG